MATIKKYTKKDGSIAYEFKIYLGIDPLTGKMKFTTRRGFKSGSFTVELKYFRSMPWYKAIFLSNFFNFILVLSTYFMVK